MASSSCLPIVVHGEPIRSPISAQLASGGRSIRPQLSHERKIRSTLYTTMLLFLHQFLFLMGPVNIVTALSRNSFDGRYGTVDEDPIAALQEQPEPSVRSRSPGLRGTSTLQASNSAAHKNNGPPAGMGPEDFASKGEGKGKKGEGKGARQNPPAEESRPTDRNPGSAFDTPGHN